MQYCFMRPTDLQLVEDGIQLIRELRVKYCRSLYYEGAQLSVCVNYSCVYLIITQQTRTE